MVRQTDASDVDLQQRFAAFVTERYPLTAALAVDAFAAAHRHAAAALELARKDSAADRLEFELRDRLRANGPTQSFETTPGVAASTRFAGATTRSSRPATGSWRENRCAPRSPPTSAARSCAAWC